MSLMYALLRGCDSLELHCFSFYDRCLLTSLVSYVTTEPSTWQALIRKLSFWSFVACSFACNSRFLLQFQVYEKSQEGEKAVNGSTNGKEDSQSDDDDDNWQVGAGSLTCAGLPGAVI